MYLRRNLKVTEERGPIINGVFCEDAVISSMYSRTCMYVHCTATGDTLPGFVEYSYKHILPACFIAPLEASFDLNDGHAFLVRLNAIKMFAVVDVIVAIGYRRNSWTH